MQQSSLTVLRPLRRAMSSAARLRFLQGKWTPELASSIQNKLQATWSPEQIMERLRQERRAIVCFKTIYRWLYHGRLEKGILTVLRHKGKGQKPAERRGTFAIGKSITQRPKEVRSRKTFGHGQLDTVVSGRGKSKGCVTTFIERKTRLYTAIRCLTVLRCPWRSPLE